MNTKQTKGFTIIEVVLVLAIAGLIFLMVFVALPSLQRGQRDTQRREDASRVMSQLTSYATNNKGSLPAKDKFNTFLTNYMKSGGGEFKDPKTGSSYTVSTEEAGDATIAVGQIQYIPGKGCDGENATKAGNSRQASVRMKLEGSGVYCQSVQQ